jgi:tRNA C32,U32 (ribose-2'-O)-methylase TrmJ
MNALKGKRQSTPRKCARVTAMKHGAGASDTYSTGAYVRALTSALHRFDALIATSRDTQAKAE